MVERQPRLVADRLVYHARNGGNNRQAVLSDGADRAAFFEALGHTKERYPFRLYRSYLMGRHFPLLLQPEAGQTLAIFHPS